MTFGELLTEIDPRGTALRRVRAAGIAPRWRCDHVASEALYLRDSDDQGMELYCDWPRELWPVSAKGELDMVSHRLDLRALLAEPGTAQCDSRRRT